MSSLLNQLDHMINPAVLVLKRFISGPIKLRYQELVSVFFLPIIHFVSNPSICHQYLIFTCQYILFPQVYRIVWSAGQGLCDPFQWQIGFLPIGYK